jgi:hypothetical protein
VGMANVLNEEKKQQVLALGRLGWSLRRIQQATGIRRETAGAYLKAAGIAVRPPSGWGRCEPKPANEVITDSGAAKPAIPVIPDPLDPNVNPNPNPNPNPENLSTKGKARATSKPANENEVITDSAVVTSPSACEPYREAIDLGLSRGRNARAIWQDLVSEYGFASSYQSVQRFVRKRRGTQTPEARVVIVTAAGQEAQDTQSYVESCYAFATTALAAELHRQHGYRVRFNDNPKYPQILELVEEVPLPKRPALPCSDLT